VSATLHDSWRKAPQPLSTTVTTGGTLLADEQPLSTIVRSGSNSVSGLARRGKGLGMGLVRFHDFGLPMEIAGLGSSGDGVAQLAAHREPDHAGRAAYRDQDRERGRQAQHQPRAETGQQGAQHRPSEPAEPGQEGEHRWHRSDPLRLPVGDPRPDGHHAGEDADGDADQRRPGPIGRHG
jgi:hypothetical protein